MAESVRKGVHGVQRGWQQHVLHTTSFGFAFRVGYSEQPSRALALEDFTSHSDKQRLRLISEQQDGNFEGHIRYVRGHCDHDADVCSTSVIFGESGFQSTLSCAPPPTVLRSLLCCCR